VGGTLYGTTFEGGNDNEGCGGLSCGTVYSVTTAGAETVLYRFGESGGSANSPSHSLVDVNGTLYGTAAGGKYGFVYKIQP
jgi:uncharacterized repeat protein (TIGR03803 family)